MSTMIALFLVLSALAGCAGETLANVKNALPDPAPISYQLDYSSYEETFPGEEGETAARFAYTVPVLRALWKDGTPVEAAESPQAERALALMEAFNAMFSDWRADTPHVREMVAEAREIPSGQPLIEELRCTAYQAGRLISVSGEYYSYTGGIHPNTMLLGWNFDLDSGTFFAPELLGEDGALKEAVTSELARQAEAAARGRGMAPEDYFWADYVDILADWSSYAVSFDEEGMTVGFSPYELACYAAGPQVFHLTYDELFPHLGTYGRTLLGLEDAGEE